MLAIINYDMGNLRSVQKAFERVGHEAVITDDPAVVADAQRVVLPGVGAFRDAMTALGDRNLVEPIKQTIAAGKPFLGICLGLQLLFETSYEDGEHAGLGILPGRVVKFDFPPPGENEEKLKVPHMGWNTLIAHRQAPIYAGIDRSEHFYFVHSYYVEPSDPALIATQTDYSPPGGKPFCSSVWRDNVIATQFHPEKSQAAGLKLLENFAQL